MSALLARGASSSLAAQGLKATRGQKSVSAAPLAPSRPSRGSTIRTHALLDFLKPKTKTKRETVVLEPSYNLQVRTAQKIPEAPLALLVTAISQGDAKLAFQSFLACKSECLKLMAEEVPRSGSSLELNPTPRGPICAAGRPGCNCRT